MLKLDLFAGTNISLFGFFLFVFMILLLINPLSCCYRSIRFEIIKTLFQILIAPFGLVRFRHFFLADILTSLVKPLVDVRYCICYFLATTSWLKDSDRGCYNSESRGLRILDLVITMLPYWFRFAQCLKKFSDTRLKVQLLNALKYFVSLMIPVASIGYQYHYSSSYYLALFLSVSILGALYSYSWDIYMDWGLLRTNTPGKRLLRKRLMYPVWSYYLASVLDLLLRFAWVISLLPMRLINEFWGEYFQVFLADILEWFRRSMWAAFRVQNENINNYERYRAVPDIPKLKLEESSQLREKIKEEKRNEIISWPNVLINAHSDISKEYQDK